MRRLGQHEDLRALALRELGDPARWTEIAELNDLRLPFIVRSYKAEDRLPHTLIWGDAVKLPSVQQTAPSPTSTGVLGTDIALRHDDLVISDGDLSVLSGAENVVQALHHRLRSLRGELVYHPRYGSSLALAIGLPAGPFRELTAAGWAYEAIAAEPRVSRIEGVDAKTEGDAVRIGARVVAVGSNSPVDLNLVFP